MSYSILKIFKNELHELKELARKMVLKLYDLTKRSQVFKQQSNNATRKVVTLHLSTNAISLLYFSIKVILLAGDADNSGSRYD